MKKLKVILVFVSIISIAFVLNLLAQSGNGDIFERINRVLAEKDLATIKKADDLLKQADNKLKEVEKEEEKFEKFFPKKANKGERKAVDAKILRIEAGDLRAKAYSAKFKVYKYKLESEKFEYADDEQLAKELLAEAEKSLNSGNSLLKSYMGIKKSDLKNAQYAKIQKDMAKVLEMQEFALDKTAEAYEIWFQQNEKKMKEMAENEAWVSAQNSNTINAYQAYLSKFPYGAHAGEAKTRISQLQEDEQIAAEEEERKRLAESEKTKTSGVWFEVQVMAVTKQAKPEVITKIYKGSESVREFQDDGWFKYSVGKFQSYKEAKDFKSSTGVKGAFVVAFQDEQPITIREAKKLVKNN
jgi:hypothetical protein